MLKPVFICPDCNREFANPEYKDGSLFSYRRWPYPVCPSGHILQSWVFGNLKPMRWWLAFLRGAGTTLLILAFAIFSDADLFYKYGETRPVIVTAVMALMCGYGLWALLMAWLWSGIDGPVGKLLPRAYGIALGFLLPAVFALLAIRLRWVAYPVDVARWFALSLNPARLLASF